jgi:putative peptidoglycan lipid II flippase
MVQNVIHLVHKEIRGLHQAAYILAIFTFGSQILALFRDRLLAHQFGASTELDLYYAAFRIPDVLYVVFASTLSVYVLIPFIAKRIEKNSFQAAQNLLSQLLSLFTVCYGIIALVAILCAPVIVTHIFPGFGEQSETLVLLIRILLIQPFLLGISSLLGIVTQLEHRFMLYALSPILYNVGIIFGLIFFYPLWGISGLAFGVILGALGHVCIQIPSVRKSKLIPFFTCRFVYADIVEVLKTSCTRALTLSFHQLVLLGFVSFASLMTIGSVSVFQFAYNLQSVPLAIIGVSYSVAAFPLLAQLYAEKKFELLGSNITTAIRHILFWSLPTIALFVVVRAQFVRVVLGSGEFDWNDTRLTAAVLALFSISLTSQALHLLIVRALYAVENSRIPFFVTGVSSIFALGFAYCFHLAFLGNGAFYTFFESVMRLEGVRGIEVLALPLGYSCALIIHSLVLVMVSRSRLYLGGRSILTCFIQSMVSAFVAGYVAYASLNYFVVHFTVDTLLTVFLQGFFACLLGVGGYIGAQRIFGNIELSEIIKALRKRFTKDDVVLSQDEDTLAV